MTAQVKRALVAAGITLALSVNAAALAAAATSSSETVHGVIVASGVSGTRTVISSVAVAKGVFRGEGEILGMPRQPSDPANLSRADLVYPEGTMHLVSTTVGVSSSVNPHSCLFRATTQENATSPAGPGCSPMRLAPTPARSVPRGCCPATPTAAARSGNQRCTRWTRSRSAER